MPFEAIITKAKQNPKKLFLLDGFGAVLSAFLLGIVLVKYETIFGIPASALYVLATIPVFFLLFDIYCYNTEHAKTGLFLKVIAVLNFLYCCLSLGYAFFHLDTITLLGWIYLIVEIVIVLLIALIEFRVGSKIAG